MARKFPSAVKSVTIVGGNGGDDKAAGGQVVYRRRGRKKRTSPGLRKIEKYVRRVVRAQESFASTYLSRHDRSSRDRKNGWLRDVISNTARALDPALRKITR